MTEVFAAPIVSSPDPAAEVARLVSAERRKRGLPALARDAALDQVAAREVAAAASFGVLKLPDDPAGSALEQRGDLRSAVAEIFVGTAPEDAVRSRNLAEASWKRLGVGAIYASSKTYGAGRLWVVLLYGR